MPYYRAHLKSAALQGTVVVNDPFWWEADEKFFECTLARKIGVAVPKTVVLPNKEYIPDIDPAVSLRNLRFPLDWEAIVAYTGLPAVLKPNTGGGWKDVHVVDSLEELWRAYDTSGQKTMILQEFIDVGGLCPGASASAARHILPIRYDPRREFFERYRIDEPLPDWLYEAGGRKARDAWPTRSATTWTPSSSRCGTGSCTRSTS